MELKKCSVCGNGIKLKKEKVYIAKECNSLVNSTIYNAIDCPFCGCQTILKKRLYEVKKGETK